MQAPEIEVGRNPMDDLVQFVQGKLTDESAPEEVKSPLEGVKSIIFGRFGNLRYEYVSWRDYNRDDPNSPLIREKVVNNFLLANKYNFSALEQALVQGPYIGPGTEQIIDPEKLDNKFQLVIVHLTPPELSGETYQNAISLIQYLTGVPKQETEKLGQYFTRLVGEENFESVSVSSEQDGYSKFKGAPLSPQVPDVTLGGKIILHQDTPEKIYIAGVGVYFEIPYETVADWLMNLQTTSQIL